MNPPKPIELIDIEPIGTKTNPAFVDWHDPDSPTGMSGTLKMVTDPVYPEPDFDLRRWRLEHHINLRDASARLGISALELCNMEKGKQRPSEGWQAVIDRLKCPTTIDNNIDHEVNDG